MVHVFPKDQGVFSPWSFYGQFYFIIPFSFNNIISSSSSLTVCDSGPIRFQIVDDIGSKKVKALALYIRTAMNPNR